MKAKPFVMPTPVDEKALALESQILALVHDIHLQLGHDTTHPPALLTEAEAALVLHQQPKTLQSWRYAQSKSLPARKICSTVLYLPRDLAAFILSCKGDAQ
ncbi:MAG: helix-turn-helix domain-containing protein [Candidatus Delongbacteria bacterium]